MFWNIFVMFFEEFCRKYTVTPTSREFPETNSYINKTLKRKNDQAGKTNFICNFVFTKIIINQRKHSFEIKMNSFYSWNQ